MDDTKLGGVAGTPEGCAAFQEDGPGSSLFWEKAETPVTVQPEEDWEEDLITVYKYLVNVVLFSSAQQQIKGQWPQTGTHQAPSEHGEEFYCESDKALAAQRACEFSFSGDVQSAPGHFPVQPAVVNLF